MADQEVTTAPNGCQDITGRVFGRLTVLGFVEKRGRRLFWLCRCQCGTCKAVSRNHLSSGHAQSCGCLRREKAATLKRTHGRSDSVEHRIWRGIKSRCHNPNSRQYADYGGRGILVCKRWKASFEAFFTDMGPRPSANHSIDRINNDRGYSPENCRWAERKQQNRNSRHNHLFTYNEETLCLAEWADRFGISPATLSYRLHRGWDFHRAVTRGTGPKAR